MAIIRLGGGQIGRLTDLGKRKKGSGAKATWENDVAGRENVRGRQANERIARRGERTTQQRTVSKIWGRVLQTLRHMFKTQRPPYEFA